MSLITGLMCHFDFEHQVNRGGIYLTQDGVHLSLPKDWLLVMHLCF